VSARRPRSSKPSKRSRRQLDESPNLRPISLRPPELVELDADHERQALDALAELLASYLDRKARCGDTSRP
jgi:hypothetical protein